MVLFPNSKINLGLSIVRKRNDGFHDIESVFYPLNIFDALEIVSSGDNFQFTTSGLEIGGNEESNLCVRAFELLKRDFPQVTPVKMHLHKTIPPGGGLGGGSSDAAFTMKLLNQKFSLGLTEQKLLDYALLLGSDCPFFIINKPCFSTGRGEILKEMDIDLSAYKSVIVNPQIRISTSWAFTHVIPTKPARSFKDIIRQPIETWKTDLKNSFEEIVFKQYPVIKNIKEELYKAGAVYSSLSGSGSTVYGIFKKEQDLTLKFPSNYFVRTVGM